MEPIRSFTKHENLHFNNEQDTHMMPENYIEIVLWPRLDFANRLVTNCVFHILGEEVG
jgi:hypothetical protein